jgi:hypothetical protein
MSDQLFQLMLTTWMTDPSERPDFSDILQTLSEMLSSTQVAKVINRTITNVIKKQFNGIIILILN